MLGSVYRFKSFQLFTQKPLALFHFAFLPTHFVSICPFSHAQVWCLCCPSNWSQSYWQEHFRLPFIGTFLIIGFRWRSMNYWAVTLGINTGVNNFLHLLLLRWEFPTREVLWSSCYPHHGKGGHQNHATAFSISLIKGH